MAGLGAGLYFWEVSTESLQAFSLLWPAARKPASRGFAARSAGWTADLNLQGVVRGLAIAGCPEAFARGVLEELCQDVEVIRYRQDVLGDVGRLASLEASLEALLPLVGAIERYYVPREPGDTLHELAHRLGELDSYVKCMNALGALLSEARGEIRSDGLLRLLEIARGVEEDETFQHLSQELPSLLAALRGTRSLTIGLNLDQDLRPSEALLVSVNTTRFTFHSTSLLRKIFGGRVDREAWEGVAPLRKIETGSREKARPPNPMLAPLFRDLSDLMERVCRPIASALKRYQDVTGGFLPGLGEEIAFYIGATRLERKLQGMGLPTCRPRIKAPEERTCSVQGCYSPALAVRLGEQSRPAHATAGVVTNDVNIDRDHAILVLTGPNQGGKTTYLQSVGLAQVMAQAGLFAPGSSATISPVDAIFTHFPVEERPEFDDGRLGEEAGRISLIFQQATSSSLVLLNESLASTSHGEALALAVDVVRALEASGGRAIFITHLHELAAEARRLSEGTGERSRVVSMVALTEEQPGMEGSTADAVRSTFRIVEGSSTGSSHASAIAHRYGISYQQLLQALRSRGVIA